MTPRLEPPDSFYLRAAQGWLELGNLAEATLELENIRPDLRKHPAVLKVRCAIHAAAKQWEASLEIATALTQSEPEDPLVWVSQSCAMHQLRRTAEARDNRSLQTRTELHRRLTPAADLLLPMPYTCSTCGEEHTDLPHIGFAAPSQWADDLAKDPNSLLTEDLCIIEGRDFFVHGVIEIPVHDFEYEFGWGVWVSHKKENFEIYREHFDTPEIGPFFGWLCTKIDYYPESTLERRRWPTIRAEDYAHAQYWRSRSTRSLVSSAKAFHCRKPGRSSSLRK